MTWLLLMAEVQDPIARKPPAISQLADITGQNHAVIRFAQVIDRYPHRKSQQQCDYR